MGNRPFVDAISYEDSPGYRENVLKLKDIENAHERKHENIFKKLCQTMDEWVLYIPPSESEIGLLNHHVLTRGGKLSFPKDDRLGLNFLETVSYRDDIFFISDW